jgi:hypothetical protein
MTGNHEGRDRPSQFLTIPYAPDDIGAPGQRPLPGGLAGPPVYWACPSISVAGPPGTFEPGRDLAVTVTVRNAGGGSVPALATVTVWWALPSTGFTDLRFHGQASVVVPSKGGTATTAPIVRMIPADAPSHICLLALVTAPADLPEKDPASGKLVVDPVGDRHWAQLNLNAIKTGRGGAFAFPFLAGNPLPEAARFRLLARPVRAEPLRMLARLIGLEPVPLEDLGLTVAPRAGEGRSPEATVTLGPGEREEFVVAGRLPDTVDPGRFTAVEVVQLREEDEAGRHPVGGIGLTLMASR